MFTLTPVKMPYNKVIIGFGTGLYSDWDFVGKATHIVESMTDNPFYPTPKPTLVEVSAGLSTYAESLNKSEDGSKQDTVNKNNNRKALEYLLRDLGLYVQTTSAGDEAKILSSGFDVKKPAQAAGPLEQPMGLMVEQDSNSGVVHVSCAAVENAHSYIFEYTESPIVPQSVWLNNVTLKHRTTFNGLSSGQIYIFRVAGLGTDPTRKWSEPVSRMVI